MPKPYPLAVVLAAAVAALAATAPAARGWIDCGHKVVALVAWEDLTPATRAAVTDLLKHHPRYEKDLLSGGQLDPQPAGETAGLSADQLARRAFAAAAVWPDLIKAPAHPMRVQFSHSEWHYIDVPYVVGDTTRPAEPAGGERSAKPGPRNVVEAIAACVAELKDPAAPPARRAIDVCWVAHLVGDVHQPLHCATLIDAQFPHGDAGGNDEFVLRDGRYPNTRTNLHLLWDSLPGEFTSDDLDRFEALGLRADPATARAAMADRLAVRDVGAWARESHALAIADAYLDGHLNAAASLPGSHGNQTDRPAPGVPPGYMERAEHVAMHQVALAGYRLADVLNDALEPQGGGR